MATLAFLVVPPRTSAGDVSFDFDGNSYTIVVTGAVWSAASTAAQSSVIQGVPGHLCIIGSDAEDAAVFNNMVIAGVDTVASNGGGAIYGWLGGSDDSGSIPGASEGEFYWIDSTQFWTGGMAGGSVGGAYSNFGRPQEPDNFQGQDHLAMALETWPVGSPAPFGGPGQWNDINSEDLQNELAYCVEHDLTIFSDGFESGNMSAWSATLP